jgi:hypothetical protein
VYSVPAGPWSPAAGPPLLMATGDCQDINSPGFQVSGKGDSIMARRHAQLGMTKGGLAVGRQV